MVCAWVPGLYTGVFDQPQYKAIIFVCSVIDWTLKIDWKDGVGITTILYTGNLADSTNGSDDLVS